MDENETKKLTQLLESFDLPLEKIDEIVFAIKQDRYKESKDPEAYKKETEAKGVYLIDDSAEIKEQMDKETDWRKRASLAAKIISMGIE